MELSDLIDAIDIVEFLSQFVDLEQRGEEFWGCSCFKEEKTPSFSVRQTPPCFYDYSSGIGGNVFTFVRFYFHYTPAQAIEYLKKYLGITGEMADVPVKPSAAKVAKRFSKAKYTQNPSKATILPANYMERYEKREDKLAVWKNEGISTASLNKFEVYYDAFSNRLVYPIKNIDGNIVNVGGRTLDPDFKAKGLRKYCYFFQWGRLDTVYGLFENLQDVKNKKEIILFEGCKSVLLTDTWGIHNTGAILTSHLNPEQLKILARLGVRVVFALDKDVNVLKDHNIERLRRYVPVEYIYDAAGLLDDKDAPVDKGAEVFQKLYSERRHYN